MRSRRWFLTALGVLMLVGFGGLAGCDDDYDPIDVASMAGVYDLDMITEKSPRTGGNLFTIVPPDLEGAITLTAAGTFSYDYIILGNKVTGGGTFTVDDPYVTFTETGDVQGLVSNVTHGIVSNSGNTITIRESAGDTSFSWTVSRNQ